MRPKCLILLVLAVLLPPAGVAANPFLEIRTEHWEEAISISGVDSDLLYAIALVESGTTFKGMRRYGPWPWTLNVDRNARFFPSRAAARKDLEAEVAAGNDRIAVGIWQIYLRWNGHLVHNPLDLLDPVTNLYAAAAVLRDCGKRFDSTRAVLSCYHAGSVREVGLSYADRVVQLAERWGEPFQMPVRHPGVRFTLAGALAEELTTSTPGPTQVAKNEAEVPSEAAGTIVLDAKLPSLVRLAAMQAPVRTQSHRDFMARMNEKKSEWAQRVVIVE